MTGIDDPNDLPLPLLVDPQLALRMIGRWHDGGLLEIRYGKKAVDVFDLPPPEWTVLGLLMKASQRSADSHWALAFMSTRKLARELRQLAHRGNGSPANVHRAINRLRKLLDGSVVAGLPLPADPLEKSFGKQLIEQHSKFGYRISLPPGQLYLTALEDDADSNPPPA